MQEKVIDDMNPPKKVDVNTPTKTFTQILQKVDNQFSKFLDIF